MSSGACPAEVNFELTDEMFDVRCPGQYDSRIQSIRGGFPGLAKAGPEHVRGRYVINRCTRWAFETVSEYRGRVLLASGDTRSTRVEKL